MDTGPGAARLVNIDTGQVGITPEVRRVCVEGRVSQYFACNPSVEEQVKQTWLART